MRRCSTACCAIFKSWPRWRWLGWLRLRHRVLVRVQPCDHGGPAVQDYSAPLHTNLDSWGADAMCVPAPNRSQITPHELGERLLSKKLMFQISRFIPQVFCKRSGFGFSSQHGSIYSWIILVHKKGLAEMPSLVRSGGFYLFLVGNCTTGLMSALA